MQLIDETEYQPINDDKFDLSAAKVMCLIIISYLLFVFQIGPRYMKNRPAYKLKSFISIYNIFQVLTCLYINNRVWNLTSWSIFSLDKCIHHLPNTPERAEFDSVSCIIFLLKIIELTDTILFVLRKKQNQITYLHVFHHSSTIMLCYLVLRYARSNVALFPVFLNNYVHVIMYTYYFFANICSAETMKKFIYLKKTITIIQMIQFCLILGQAALMWTSCKIPPTIKHFYCLVILAIFYGFYDFYKKAYLSKQAQSPKISSK